MRNGPARIALLVAGLWPAACASLPPGAECRSLDGRVLRPPALPAERRAEQEALLTEARAALATNPDDRGAAIWVGRRLGYLGRCREAIAAYDEAHRRWPDDPFVLRHRGHRWISVREFDRAVRDLERAAVACRTVADEVEPDGLPVPGRPPHSTLHFNVHYHLGLAHFLAGDFAAAEHAWLRCLACCRNDESRVAVAHWLWCVRMRRGDPAGAAAVVAGIGPDLDVVENTSYHRLCRLYAGALARDAIEVPGGSAGAALRFGLAHFDLVTGARAAARRELEALAALDNWAAFGVIAAEAELARWRP